MGQQEIYDFLKKNKGQYFTSKNLVKELNVSTSSFFGAMRRLLNYKDVHKITIIKIKYRNNHTCLSYAYCGEVKKEWTLSSILESQKSLKSK